MSLSLTNPSLGLGLRNNILGALGLPGSSAFEMRQLWSNGEQGVWYEPYDPNAILQRENLLTFTDQFDNAAWTKTGSTVTANAYSGRWDKIVEDTSTGAHQIQSANFTASAGFTYAIQAKLRAGERDKFRLLLSNAVTWNGVNPSVSVDLTLVTVSTANGAANATIEALGNGEFLVKFTAVATTDNTSGLRIELRDAAGATSYTGVAATGAFATDAQVERAQFANGYQRVTDWNTEYLASIASPNIAMYQDAAGTIPVTSVEQPVGLLLDKRLSLARGVELNTAGTNADSLIGVSETNNGDGTFTYTQITPSNNDCAGWSPALLGGKTYEITAVLSAPVATPARLRLFANVPGFRVVADQTITISTTPTTFHIIGTFNAGESATGMLVYPDSGSASGNSVRVHSMSAKEILGNPATQSTAAARPVLSARKNLFTKTEQFNDALWAKTECTVISNAAVSPRGDVTATRLVDTVVNSVHQASTAATLPDNTNVAFSVFAKAGERTFLRLAPTTKAGVTNATYFNLANGTLGNVGVGHTASIVLDGNGYYLCTVVYNTGAGASASTHRIGMAAANGTNVYVGDGASGLFVWGAQLELGSTATRYQRVNTATDYDTAGFPHYLKFDGVDDFLVTGNINFTTTDKMTVWAGVTKLSDAATGVVVELTANSNTTAGAFGLFGSFGAAPNYGYQSRGTGTVSEAAASGAPSPNTSVLTGVSDIAGDVSIQRRNAVQVASGIVDQGIGTYANAPLYIGRRGGASLSFTGQLNSLAIRGAASTTTQIKETERAIATKTGVNLP